MLVGCTPRQVGYALSHLNDDSVVPWHRIINRAGKVSCRADGNLSLSQMDLLAMEGIPIRLNGSINLDHYAWLPLDRQALLAIVRVGIPEDFDANG